MLGWVLVEHRHVWGRNDRGIAATDSIRRDRKPSVGPVGRFLSDYALTALGAASRFWRRTRLTRGVRDVTKIDKKAGGFVLEVHLFGGEVVHAPHTLAQVKQAVADAAKWSQVAQVAATDWAARLDLAVALTTAYRRMLVVGGGLILADQDGGVWNPAHRLYDRIGFVLVRRDGDCLTMTRETAR
jgi:hypothetical protein